MDGRTRGFASYYPSVIVVGSLMGVHVITHNTFTELYDCPKPDDTKTYGFDSWDKFFTRECNEPIRPIPDDATSDSVIVHPCESAPLQDPVSKVQRSDNFQGKNQYHSLIDMMNQHELADGFVGGTFYQAFLSCLGYRRWHAGLITHRISTRCSLGIGLRNRVTALHSKCCGSRLDLYRSGQSCHWARLLHRDWHDGHFRL